MSSSSRRTLIFQTFKSSLMLSCSRFSSCPIWLFFFFFTALRTPSSFVRPSAAPLPHGVHHDFWTFPRAGTICNSGPLAVSIGPAHDVRSPPRLLISWCWRRGPSVGISNCRWSCGSRPGFSRKRDLDGLIWRNGMTTSH